MFQLVDEKSFEGEVLSASSMVLVNFWAWWSDDCHNMSSVMHNMTELLDEQDTIVQLDWNQHRRLAWELEVYGVPTLLIYIRGREVARFSGVMSEDELVRRIIEAKNHDGSSILQ
ncbi:MAG: thioredoxin family protein [Deltaproteobacteria bacterium]|nr:MAG: thioredoxin family protein [Deltaproteobacteria bacterium]